MSKGRLITLLLVFLLAAPVAGIALWSISRTAFELGDPCAQWDQPSGQPVYAHIGPRDTCRQHSIHSESRTQAALRAAAVPGGLLLAAMLALAGTALSRRWMMFAAGSAMLVETLVVFTIAPLTLIVGLGFLLLAGRVRPGVGQSKPN